VTTSAYLAKDSLALTLKRFHLERIADAIRDTAVELRAYMNRHEEFAAIGERMLEEWENGCRAD
jgi:hypothetical protein